MWIKENLTKQTAERVKEQGESFFVPHAFVREG